MNLRKIFFCNLTAVIVIAFVSIISLISIVAINRFISYKKKMQGKPQIKIVTSKRANKLSSEFLLAYILPMIAFDFTKIDSVILFMVYFGMLAFLCIRNNNVYTNILLELKGYRMYSCDLEGTVMGRLHTYGDCLVISKNNLIVQVDNNIRYWDFNNYIYMDLD